MSSSGSSLVRPTGTAGHSKGADEDLAGETAHLFFGLAADADSSAEEGAASHQEDLGELFVVVGHHGGSRRFLGLGEQDVLDGAEGFLPELEFNGGVELGKAGSGCRDGTGGLSASERLVECCW